MNNRPYSVYAGESRRKQRLRLTIWSTGAALVIVAAVMAAILMGGFDRVAATTGPTGDPSTTEASTTTSESTTTTLPLTPNTTVVDYDPTQPGDTRLAGSFYGPIQTSFEGLTCFRGNLSRTYYGEGPVPADPAVLWRFGPMKGTSTNLGSTSTWTGTGWTGQPCVFERDGKTWVVFGAYDYKIHFLDAATGERLLPDFAGKDIFKGSVVVDPDGFPLIYMGCRDNKWRIISIDGEKPTEVFSLDSDDLPEGIWNDDWDSSVLIRNDYAFEGCENGHFYILKLNRAYGSDGKVTVDPEIVLDFKGWDQKEISNIGSKDVGIENSPCLVGDRLYFTNSGGLVTCLDVSATLEELGSGEKPATGASAYPVLFQFWTGEDSDSTIVADEQGYVYVSQHSDNERQSSVASSRAKAVGQVIKLDPRKADKNEDPVVWSVPVTKLSGGEAGVWATPTLYKDMLYVSTHNGALLGIDRATGEVVWRKSLSYHDWASCAVVDGKLIVGDTAGILHAWDVSNTRVDPPAVWSLPVSQGALESSPAVWKGRIYLGSRDGYFYCFGDK